MQTMKEMFSMPRVRKALIGLVIFLFLFSIVGFFILPPILKSVLTKTLSEKLHREVTIQGISVNPFMLSMNIRGGVVKDTKGQGTFVSFDELYLNFQSMSVLKRGLILSEVKLVKPSITIIRGDDMRYNFSDLIDESGSKQDPGQKPFRFSLNNIQVLNGSLDFWDGPMKTGHKVKDITITIPFISNLPYYIDTYVQPSFEAVVNDHAVAFKGKTKPFTGSRETTFDVEIKDLDIPHYLAYVPFKLNVILASGFVSVKTSLSYVQYTDRVPTINVAGAVSCKNIQITDKKQTPLLSLPLVDVAITSTDLMSMKMNFSKVFLQSPELNLSRDKTGNVNLQVFVPEKRNVVKKKEESPALAVDVDEIAMTGGKISFSDLSGTAPFRSTLENIELKIDHFNNGKDKKSAMALSLQTEASEGVKITGDFSVNPLASGGTVELRGVQLKKYSPYYQSLVLFDVSKGDLDLTAQYAYAKGEADPELRIAGMAATIHAMSLRKRDEDKDFLTAPLLEIKDTAIDLPGRELSVGELSGQKGTILVNRSKDGAVNLQNLVPSSADSGAPAKTVKGKGEKPWLIKLKNLTVDGYTIIVEDRVPSEPVRLVAEKIRLRGDSLSNEKKRTGKVSLSLVLNKNGSLSTNGSLGLDPLVARMKLDLKGIEIDPLQPYFTERIKIIVTDGAISAKGNLSLDYTHDRGVNVAYKGEASLSHFASVDKINAEDFLKWGSLYLSSMDIGWNPLLVHIDEISVTDFYSRLIINDDGTLNVQGIVEEEPAKPEAPSSKQGQDHEAVAKKNGPQKMVTIDKVTFQNGTINFSDRHIKPNYSANLLEIGGRVSGLSSEENTVADVDLRGKLDNYAPLEITGKINPLREDLFVDLKASFKDIDLSPVTPYTGRYLGYTIQKGKLSLNIQYLIVKKKLDSQNNIFLDQFTLGDSVDSPDATKLPVKLAIALLKNRKGEIQLDLPVTGYIDDPKFSLGSIIIKILTNILVKAATSPFALLGAIFGGGEELSYLEFDYGTSTISTQEEKKISTLVKALSDRPALKLDIEGHVDMEKDREGLHQYLFQKKIKAQKVKEIVKKGGTAPPVDDVTIERDEYPKYLKMAYKEEKFPKPRNIIGMAKDLPEPEMEKLMLTHIEIKDDDLRLLASQRALKVKDAIVHSKQIEPERIFLVEPKTLAPEKKEKLKDSRVDFKLK
jgi:uncharacterized protein involved in outer membrane biogenesis